MVRTTPDADALFDPLWDAYRACRSVENRNALVVAYLPNVERHLSRVRNAGIVQRDDVRQWAAEALMRSVEKFDHRPGIRFTSFLARRIRWAIIDGYRDTLGRQMPNGIHCGIVAGSLDDHSKYWLSAPSCACKAEIADQVRHALRGLSRQRRLIILLRFSEGMTIKETAATLGLSGWTVINESKMAMAQMREKICQQEQ